MPENSHIAPPSGREEWVREQAKLLQFNPPPGRWGLAVATLYIVFIYGVALSGAAYGITRLVQKGSAEDLKPTIVIIGPSSLTDNGYTDWAPALLAIQNFVASNKTSVLNKSLSVRFENDHNDTILAKQKAKDFCSDKSVIGVVGYVWSSVAQQAIDALRTCSKPLPLILVGATQDRLTDANGTSWNQPILLMSASNFFQAKQIAQGLGDTFSAKEKPRALLVQDPDNPGYAQSLSAQIMQAANQFKKADILWKEKTYANENWLELMESNSEGLDIVIFVGNTANAARLVESRPNSVTKPLLIVTDGAVNAEYLKRAGLGARCVWGTFPASRRLGEKVPSFASAGLDAIALVDNWAERTQSSNRTRAGLAEHLRQIAVGRTSVYINGTKVEFDSRGRISLLTQADSVFWGDLYHFWQANNVSGSTLEWKHRERRTSLFECH